MVTTTREIFAIASREKPMTSPDIKPPVVITDADKAVWRELLSLSVSNADRRACGEPIVHGLHLIAAHRLSTQSSMQARIEELESEVERWATAQGMSFNQAMANGQDASDKDRRIEELEAALRRIVERSHNDVIGTAKVIDMREIARAALSKGGQSNE